MPTIFQPELATAMLQRLQRLQPNQPRAWGTMTLGQALAHCSSGFEMAMGVRRPPRVLIGRVLGPVIKRFAFGNEAPMRLNSPTSPDLVVGDARDFEVERTRLTGLVERFVAAGEAGCTTHSHPFFGRLAPAQWAELMYKHMDHHLRQFGA